MNGETLIDELDIVKEAGSSHRGIERVFTELPVTDGTLDVEFATLEGDPIVNIIVLTREGNAVPPPPARPLHFPSSSPGLERVNDQNTILINYYGVWSITLRSERLYQRGLPLLQLPGKRSGLFI